MDTRSRFHKLIETIESEDDLKAYYRLISRLNKTESGKLWDSLSKPEIEDLLISYEESYDASELISNDKVKEQYSK